MTRVVAPALLALLIACSASSAAPVDSGSPIHWRQSRSLGLPWHGRLVRGVRLPDEGATFFTWDPVQKQTPNRAWRRWGSDRLLRLLFGVLDGYFEANPGAPRIGIGDLSRPHGGVFDERFGGIGHASHQNGRDVDVYYPRLDGLEAPPERPAEIDRVLAQDLVNRFVRAGAVKLFVGPRTGLRGPRRIVSTLVHHDDHVHVRIAADPPSRRRQAASVAAGRGPGPLVIGRSARGRRLWARELGDPESDHRVLVVGCIHGDECAGTAVARLLARARPSIDLWLVFNLNPDGLVLGKRQNGRGVDLNRNFPSEWRPGGHAWDQEYPGPRPLSEPESRAVARLIGQIHPEVTIWFHQPQALVRAWGPSKPMARRYARLAGMPFRAIRWPAGTAPNWQNHQFPGESSFVVELPPGELSRAAAATQARAVLRLVP